MIEPNYWGRGIGGMLLDIAANSARQADKQQLLLWTRAEDNERARGLYERKGYSLTERTRISQHGHGLQVQYALDL
jgi:ribosomal protein S18 acetylase RimI-like enzyme